MHGHRRWSRMSTLLHPHVMCVWGDIPIGLGTRVGCDLQTFCWSLPNSCWMHQSFSSHPSLRNHHLDLLIAQQPNSFCHFLVLLTFEHLNSSMLAIYDNWVWYDLKFHSDGKNVLFSNLFVILEVISLWLQVWPLNGYEAYSTLIGQSHSYSSPPSLSQQWG